MLQAWAVLGRLLIGGLFVFGGVQHFLAFGPVSGELAARRVPSPRLVLACASGFQIVAGLALIGGVASPWPAVGLIAFTVAATLLMRDFWRYDGLQRHEMRQGFINNFAIVGGLILAAVSAG